RPEAASCPRFESCPRQPFSQLTASPPPMTKQRDETSSNRPVRPPCKMKAPLTSSHEGGR
ncbi:hypothetical protein OBBRIDRAFT_796493, partial [Obba rivulosa]